jgi:hypothetical protein
MNYISLRPQEPDAHRDNSNSRCDPRRDVFIINLRMHHWWGMSVTKSDTRQQLAQPATQQQHNCGLYSWSTLCTLTANFHEVSAVEG